MGNFEGKMKWHYFLAFFWMWVVAYSQFSSFTTATSDNYFKSDDPKMQHFMDEMLVRNPGFKNAVSTYGYICMILCILAVVAGVGLLMFKKFGPYCVLGMYFLNLINNAIFVNQYQKVVNSFPSAKEVGLAMTSGISAGILFSMVFIILNIWYFIKRLHLYK